MLTTDLEAMVGDENIGKPGYLGDGFWNLALMSDGDESETVSIEEAQRRFEVGKVIERHGTWAVTDYGMECLTQHYPIEKARLFKGEPSYPWTRHMAHKRWVNIDDFSDCLDAARLYHYQGRRSPKPKSKPKVSGRSSPRVGLSPKTRFAILKRDGYRCCLCGATAETGARLHVDHKVAVAKGGTNAAENLWTLCAECNLGKHTEEL